MMPRHGSATVEMPPVSGPGLSPALAWLGGVSKLALAAGAQVARRPLELRSTLRQLDRLGVQSLGIVTITAVFTGMVLALQTSLALERYGTKQFVGQVVALSLVREMGPVLTALMVGGRVGAGITAELGSMAVTEQVDAMRALGASPVKKLVVPRLVAVVVMLPLLTVLADGMGMLGGALIAIVDLSQPSSVYWQSCFAAMEPADLLSGLGKTVFFGSFVAIIGCYNGLSARGGADGVGRATTVTVVAASISILTSDFFLTKLFLLIQ